MTTPSPASAPVHEVGSARTSQGWYGQDETTPELLWPRSMLVYDAMRKQDAQVASVLRAVCLPIRRTQWMLNPAGCRPEVAQLVATDMGLPLQGEATVDLTVVRRRNRFSWSEHLQTALLMLAYGHMFFEQVYDAEALRATGQVRLQKLAPRMPRSLASIDVAKDGGLAGITQWVDDGAGLVKIPVERLVAYVHEREGGNWRGTSLLRPAYKHQRLKDELIRVQAMTIRRNGMGIPVYEGQDGASEGDLQKGAELAQAYRAGETAGTSTPFGAKLRLLGVEGTLPDAMAAIRYHDEQIGKSVLAHFLNLNAQGGSYALASVQADTFTQSLQATAESVRDTAQQHIIEDLVDWNYGPNEPAPQLVFEEIGTRQAATAQALKLLVDAGLLFPDRPLEEALRQAHGLPAKPAAAPPTPNPEGAPA